MEYKTIKEEIDYPSYILDAIESVNLELFKQVDEEVEILKGLDYTTCRNHPRIMYEMANIRMGEVAYLDGYAYEDELYSFMTPSEQKAYDSLPNAFIAYRGYSADKIDIDEASYAQSWTLDKKIAEFFIEEHARKYKNSESVLFERVVLKSQVLLVLLSRGESEIVVEI